MLVDINIVLKIFMKILIYPMSINIGRMTTPQGTHASLVKNSPFSSLSLLMMSFEEEIQSSNNHVGITRG